MRVVILGGGLTGLTSAYCLQKENIDYIVIEKEQVVGGLCRSVVQDGFIFDYTGHFLHFDKTQTEAKKFVFELLKNRLLRLSRNAKIWTKFANTKNRLIPYPFQLNIRYLLPKVRKECVSGLVWANILGYKKKSENFSAWLISNFGYGISKYFFESYHRKLWNTNLNQISTTWVEKFVPQVDLEEVLDSIVFDKDVGRKCGYNYEFYYPKSGGIQELINAIYSRLYANKVITSAEVVNVDIKRKQVSFVRNGKTEFLNYDFIISTIPLPELLRIVNIDKIKPYADKLKYVAVVCFNVAVKKPVMKGIHWIYFPDEDISFYRVGFYHNICKNMLPKGYGSMYVEISTKQMSRIEVELAETKICKQLVRAGILSSDEEILFINILCLPYAYVLYNIDREKILPLIFNILTQYKIYSIGRYGAWKYSYMSENISDAIKTVNILKKQKN